MSEIIRDYIEHQEKKIVEMKEKVRLLSKAILEMEATLIKDRKGWGIRKETKDESSKTLRP